VRLELNQHRWRRHRVFDCPFSGRTVAEAEVRRHLRDGHRLDEGVASADVVLAPSFSLIRCQTKGAVTCSLCGQRVRRADAADHYREHHRIMLAQLVQLLQTSSFTLDPGICATFPDDDLHDQEVTERLPALERELPAEISSQCGTAERAPSQQPALEPLEPSSDTPVITLPDCQHGDLTKYVYDCTHSGCRRRGLNDAGLHVAVSQIAGVKSHSCELVGSGINIAIVFLPVVFTENIMRSTKGYF